MLLPILNQTCSRISMFLSPKLKTLTPWKVFRRRYNTCEETFFAPFVGRIIRGCEQ